MKMRIVTAVLALVSLPATLFAADSLREGLWEMTSRMEMPGMPMEMPATTMKHCYTKEDVKDQKKMVNQNKDCTVTEFKTSGNKMTWKMKCTGQSAGTFSGETVFTKDSYNSVMKMKVDAEGSQPMTVKVNAKRIGACP
jgi:hypothetical protein